MTMNMPLQSSQKSYIAGKPQPYIQNSDAFSFRQRHPNNNANTMPFQSHNLVNGSMNMSRNTIPTHIHNPPINIQNMPSTYISQQKAPTFNPRPQVVNYPVHHHHNQIPPQYIDNQYGSYGPIYTQPLQTYYPPPHHSHPTTIPVRPQPTNIPVYSGHYLPTYPQTVPIYPINDQLFYPYQPHKRNLPQQSINANFNYQHANFDVDYTVEQNMVHCVVCDQSYKASQKDKHLQKHRQKVKNINIRPVDEEQLKRLQKYNTMIRKGLITKPIVQPEEFNVQYKANQYILKRVNNYIDQNGPTVNTIAIQTSSKQQQQGSVNILDELGYDSGRKSNLIPSPRNKSNNKLQVAQSINPRLTNQTRFNNDSLRIEEQIGYQSSFRISQAEKQTLKNNNNNYLVSESFRASEINSQTSGVSKIKEPENILVGILEQNTGLKYRNDQSYNQVDSIGYRESRATKNLQKINQEEQFKASNSNLGYAHQQLLKG